MAYRQPILVLSENSSRTQGRDAQQMNFAAAKAVAEAVRTTLGPLGMDKMLVDSTGGVVITNDGVTILDEMDIEHPSAEMIVEVADSQEDEAGDGTTSAVVLAGELLAKAESLIDDDVHPSTISSGYRRAATHAAEVLEGIARSVTSADEETLQQVARTAMTGKGVGGAQDDLAELVVECVTAVDTDGDIDLDDIAIETVSSGSIGDTALVEGIVLDKDPVHDDMPTRIEAATIALFDQPIEIAEAETDAEIELTDPAQLQAFLDQEEAELRGYVETIVDSGADVVICQKGIDDLAQYYLAREGVLAVRRAKKSDMGRLAKATGARVVSNVDDIGAEDLGTAGLVEHRAVGDDERLFVEDCAGAESVTLLVRGGTEHVVEEVERALHDALEAVRVTIEDGHVVPGGGAPEIEIALALREYADGIGGREQLAIEAFADAIEVIPRTLAINAGLDPIDAIVSLRAAHDRGETAAGVAHLEQSGVGDMDGAGVVEPLRVKTQAISSAQEAADLVLRIDDVIAAGDLSGGDEDEFDDYDF